MNEEDLKFSETTRTMLATPERVFAELSDGWAYVGWVVGATHIRDVDANWPHEGSMIHHKVGSWPAEIADVTKSLRCEQNRRLMLQARAWPLGAATVDIVLTALSNTETLVTLREAPSSGPGRWLDNPVLRWILKVRNEETLSRLADRVEKRELSV
ncbi:MAG: Polyketide cyclase / dehydrase and lipid transport [Frankiales bacterium]|nr:Polyketide cyclase / dehydrase and lipid transport [Frankiales bacterium]